jgi:hypothetical protein
MVELKRRKEECKRGLYNRGKAEYVVLGMGIGIGNGAKPD